MLRSHAIWDSRPTGHGSTTSGWEASEWRFSVRKASITRDTWLRSPENFTAQAWKHFAPLRDSSLKVARAWAIKDAVGKPCSYRSVDAARTYFQWWYNWATHSRLRPIVEKARMMKRHLEGILGYLKHRLTNAISEALNSQIQAIRMKARGYRNRGNFKTAIYPHHGALDLYPLPTNTAG